MSNRPLAWITGSNGLIGNELIRIAAHHAPGFSVQGLSRSDIDLLDFVAVTQLFHQEQPHLIIHCAAQSNNVICEGDAGLAHRANVEMTKHLLDLASSTSRNVPFSIFFHRSDLRRHQGELYRG